MLFSHSYCDTEKHKSFLWRKVSICGCLWLFVTTLSTPRCPPHPATETTGRPTPSLLCEVPVHTLESAVTHPPQWHCFCDCLRAKTQQEKYLRRRTANPAVGRWDHVSCDLNCLHTFDLTLGIFRFFFLQTRQSVTFCLFSPAVINWEHKHGPLPAAGHSSPKSRHRST